MHGGYCGHCGEAAGEGERFCVACGTTLRIVGHREAITDSSPLRHAVELLARREHQQALRELTAICADDPDSAVARAYLGIAHLRLAQVADARFELEEAVRMAPESFICRAKFAELLARIGFYDQAQAQLDAALSLQPPDGDSRLAAMELRQFCKDKAKGLHYKHLAYPRLPFGSFIPRRKAHQAALTATTERG